MQKLTSLDGWMAHDIDQAANSLRDQDAIEKGMKLVGMSWTSGGDFAASPLDGFHATSARLMWSFHALSCATSDFDASAKTFLFFADLKDCIVKDVAVHPSALQKGEPPRNLDLQAIVEPMIKSGVLRAVATASKYPPAKPGALGF